MVDHENIGEDGTASDLYRPAMPTSRFKRDLHRRMMSEIGEKQEHVPYRIIFAVTAAILIIIALAPLYINQRYIGHVQVMKGEVTLGEKRVVSSGEGAVNIKRGSTVATSADSSVKVILKDRSICYAEEDTKIEISRDRRVRLYHGDILLSVTKGKKSFEVTTPKAKVVVKGTVFSVSHREEVTEVVVLEGIVEALLLSGESYTLKEQEHIIINNGVEKKAISPDKLRILEKRIEDIEWQKEQLTTKIPTGEEYDTEEPDEKKDYILYGRVVEAKSPGLPIKGAELQLFPQTHDVLTTCSIEETDEKGFFVFRSLEPAPYFLIITAEGYDQRSTRATLPGETAKTQYLEINLHPIDLFAYSQEEDVSVPLGGIIGRVTDTRGQPIPIARVDCLFQSPDGDFFYYWGRTQLSDINGTYAFHNLESFPSNYAIIASFDGYIPEQRRDIILAEAGTEAREDFMLERGKLTTFEALVVDEKGYPVEGATVYAGIGIPTREGEPGNLMAHRLAGALFKFTDRNGRCVIENLYCGEILVHAYKKGYLFQKPRKIFLKTDTPKPQAEIVLVKGSVIRGKVVDEDGKIINDAEIVMMGHRLPWFTTHRYEAEKTSTDEEGRFEFIGLEHEGIYTIMTKAQDFAPQLLKIPPDTQDLSIVLGKGGEIRGRVTKENTGEGIGGISVRLYSSSKTWQPLPRAVTDNEGFYHLYNLPEGVYTVFPRGKGLTDSFMSGISVEEAEIHEDMNFEVYPGMEISGRVVDGLSRIPIVGTIYCIHESGYTFWAVLDEMGQFRFANLPEGTYTLRVVNAKGYPDYWHDPIILQKGLDRANIKILMYKGGGQITGSIVDSQGVPVPGATVKLFQRFSPPPHLDTSEKETVSYETGAFVLEDIQITDIPLWLTVRHPDFVPEESNGIILSEERPSQHITITLRKGGSIEGTVYDNANKPLPGARIRAVSGDEIFTTAMEKINEVETIVGEMGKYVVNHVGPGEVRLTADIGGYARETRHVEIKGPDEEVTGVDFYLKPGKSISGRILDQNLHPINDARVMLFREGEPTLPEPSLLFAQTKTGIDGAFEFGNLPDQTFFLAIFYEKNWKWGKLSRWVKRDNVAAGQKDIEIVAPEDGAITGRIVNSPGGKVPDHLFITMLEERQEAVWKRGFMFDELQIDVIEGLFFLPGLPGGEYDCVFSALEFEPTIVHVKVTPGKVVNIGDISLLPED